MFLWWSVVLLFVGECDSAVLVQVTVLVWAKEELLLE